jgi:hypothetical protein
VTSPASSASAASALRQIVAEQADVRHASSKEMLAWRVVSVALAWRAGEGTACARQSGRSATWMPVLATS